MNKRITFDFNKAVAQAQLDFPEETKDVTFVDLALPSSIVIPK